MESKKFTIVKLYEYLIVAKDEHGNKCKIRPSLLARFFALDDTFYVWCTDLGDREFEIHAIRDGERDVKLASSNEGMKLARSNKVEFDQETHEKLRKFGAYYNAATSRWQIDMRIMSNDAYKQEIEEVLPDIKHRNRYGHEYYQSGR